MLSFAQNAEDVLLWRVFSTVPPEDGFYIDVGANHPVVDSVTKHFYDAGWRGINIEPVTTHAEHLAKERPRDVNLNVAAGATAGTLQFHRVVENDGLSTMDPQMAAGYEASGYTLATTDVPVVPLRDISAEHAPDTIHFLKIDVEGHEADVIDGADWVRWRPQVLVIEGTKPETWEHKLGAVGYERVLDDGINLVFVAEEHPEMREPLTRPVTVVDLYTPYEWVRRVQPVQALLARYAVPAMVDEILRPLGRRGARQYHDTATRLVETLASRDDLVRAFAGSGTVDGPALVAWALDTPRVVDEAVVALQDEDRAGLEALRAALAADAAAG